MAGDIVGPFVPQHLLASWDGRIGIDRRQRQKPLIVAGPGDRFLDNAVGWLDRIFRNVLRNQRGGIPANRQRQNRNDGNQDNLNGELHDVIPDRNGETTIIIRSRSLAMTQKISITDGERRSVAHRNDLPTSFGLQSLRQITANGYVSHREFKKAEARLFRKAGLLTGGGLLGNRWREIGC
jgi:hypothetical protein